MATIDTITDPVVDIHTILAPFEKTARTHAILCVVGFLGLLPLGAITARYTRTFTPLWFPAHMVIQTIIAGPIIIAGWALGIHSVKQSLSPKLGDTHKKLGVALFVLYLVQVMGGLIVHFFKPTRSPMILNRPIQNYFHAIMGILIIALAFWQVRLGFKTEWPTQTGLKVANGANITWIVWIVVIWVVYFGGVLLFLPRQIKQERRLADGASDEQAIKNEATNGQQTF